MTIMFIPIIYVLSDLKSLLLFLNKLDIDQSEEVALATQKYVLVQMPGMFIYGLNNIQTILLACYGKNRITTISTFIGWLVHVVCSYIFVI